MKNILIVEDDKGLAKGISLGLQSLDINIHQAFDLATARIKTNEINYDLIILDINLPDGNGLEYMQEIKKSNKIPIIMLTANDMEIDIVTGLELGADDYITKPFSLGVLRARVNLQLRKNAPNDKNCYEKAEFSFNFATMEFKKSGKIIELSKTEQKLLKILIENKGITVERGTLLDKIWTDGADYVDENALSVTIKRLRDKLEDNSSSPKYIKTVYGLGYTWVVK